MKKKRKTMTWKKRPTIEGGHRTFMGPLGFDIEMATHHGWTLAEMNRFWDRATELYKSYSTRVRRRNPHLYRSYRTGSHVTWVYTGKVPGDE